MLHLPNFAKLLRIVVTNCRLRIDPGFQLGGRLSTTCSSNFPFRVGMANTQRRQGNLRRARERTASARPGPTFAMTLRHERRNQVGWGVLKRDLIICISFCRRHCQENGISSAAIWGSKTGYKQLRQQTRQRLVAQVRRLLVTIPVAQGQAPGL